MRTSNPALNDSVFQKAHTGLASDGSMTLEGTVSKTCILTLLLTVSAFWSWHHIDSFSSVGLLLTVGWAVPLALSLVIGFVPRTAPLLSPVYAIAKGLLVGILSARFERAFDGIVLVAFTLTCCILFALLAAYRSGLIRPSENFKLGVVAATGGIALFYLVTFVLRFWDIEIPGIFGGGWVGIAFSSFVVILAALNLVLDFDFIENGCEARAPKFMEWYAAFGLLVTLVWLYLEILRLLAKLRDE
jgi:uncharacterized YccA/Bax inhibitor family protein